MKTFLTICLLSSLLAIIVVAQVSDSSPATTDMTQITDSPPAGFTCMVTNETTSNSSSKQCSDGANACVSVMDWNTLNGTSMNNKPFQTCGKSDSCASAFSITVAEGKTLTSSSVCCSTSNCNDNLIMPDSPAADFQNKLVCPVGCFALAESECKSSKVYCMGAENMCIDLTAKQNSENTSVILKGCGTKSACNLKANSLLTISGKNYTVNKAEDCKNATSSSPSVTGHSLGRGVFPLLLPGISSILFAKVLC